MSCLNATSTDDDGNTTTFQVDNGEGLGCSGAGVSAGSPSDSSSLNQGQVNATAYGGPDAASLEMQDALQAFSGQGVKNIEYLPSDRR